MLPTKPAGPDIGKSRPRGGLASVVPVVPSARHDAPGRAFRYPTAEPEHHPAWKQARAEIPAARADPLILEFRRTVRAGLASVPRIPGPEHSTAQHPGRDLLEFCRECEDDAPRFCRETSVWPTNNISERGGAAHKTQQKISGRLTSDDATQDRLDIRSYIDAGRKHGHDALTVLRSLMTGGTLCGRPPPQLARHNPAATRTTRGRSLCVRVVIVYLKLHPTTHRPHLCRT